MEGQYLKPPDSRSHFCARPLHFHVTHSLFWPLCCCSVAKLRLTLCDPVNCSTPGFPVVHYLPELTQTHVHWVGGAIQPTYPLAIPLSSYLQSFPASRSFPALLLISHFSRVWPHPWDSPGKSGLPFPSPVHKSEKWKWSRSVMFDSSRPHGLQPTRLLRPWDFPGKSTGVGCHCLSIIVTATRTWNTHPLWAN